MTAIAVELDRKLKSLDPETAASVEQIVRDVLHMAEKKQQRHGDMASRLLGGHPGRLGH